MEILNTFNNNFLLLFGLCIILGLFFYYLMRVQSRHLFTMGRVRQSFNIFDLQFAASEEELNKLLAGISKLDQREAETSRQSLSRNLWIDFLFMPCVYIGIAMVCFKTATLTGHFGSQVFVLLGLFQVLPWICDIYENSFLLRRIPAPDTSRGSFKVYRTIVFVKWGVATVALVSALSILLFIFVK